MVGFISVPDMVVCPIPAAPRVKPPVTVGADQLYVVPAGTMSLPLTGVTVNNVPLQVAMVLSEMVGVGLIVTVTVKGVPGHGMVVVGVTVYVAVTGAFVVLISVPLMFPVPAPDVPPVNPVPEGADQLYVVPAGTMSAPLIGVTVNGVPLQVVMLSLAMAGVGFIVTVTVKGVPGQAAGVVVVTVYVAVTGAFVVLISVPLMFPAPAPDVPPVNPVPEGADQL